MYIQSCGPTTGKTQRIHGARVAAVINVGHCGCDGLRANNARTYTDPRSPAVRQLSSWAIPRRSPPIHRSSPVSTPSKPAARTVARSRYTGIYLRFIDLPHPPPPRPRPSRSCCRRLHTHYAHKNNSPRPKMEHLDGKAERWNILTARKLHTHYAHRNTTSPAQRWNILTGSCQKMGHLDSTKVAHTLRTQKQLPSPKDGTS